jgi:uncharacterized membrane-anchored protein
MIVRIFRKNQEVQRKRRNTKQRIQNIRRRKVNRRIVKRRKVGDLIKRSTETLVCNMMMMMMMMIIIIIIVINNDVCFAVIIGLLIE